MVQNLSTDPTSEDEVTQIDKCWFKVCVLVRSWCVFHVSAVSEWLRLLPLLGILALLGYLTIRPFLPKKKKQKDSLINLKIQKENPKVVNEIDIEDLNSANVCYCRCWRSKTVSGPVYCPIFGWTVAEVTGSIGLNYLLSHTSCWKKLFTFKIV